MPKREKLRVFILFFFLGRIAPTVATPLGTWIRGLDLKVLNIHLNSDLISWIRLVFSLFSLFLKNWAFSLDPRSSCKPPRVYPRAELPLGDDNPSVPCTFWYIKKDVGAIYKTNCCSGRWLAPIHYDFWMVVLKPSHKGWPPNQSSIFLVSLVLIQLRQENHPLRSSSKEHRPGQLRQGSLP